MASAEVLLASAYDFVTNAEAAANTQTDATQAAPDADKQHIVQGVEFSVSGAPAASVLVSLIQDVAGTPVTLDSWRIPNAAIGPVSIRFKGIKVAAGKSVTLRIPALGAGIIGNATVMGMTRIVP